MKTPSVSEYKVALNKIYKDASEGHQIMFEAHYRAENNTITATQLAAAATYENYNAANLQYGIFCRALCKELQYDPPVGTSGEPTPTFVIATGYQDGPKKSHWKWVMRPEVVQAINELSLFPSEEGSLNSSDVHADEVPYGEYKEGAVRTVLINAYERNPEAREACLEYWGTSCVVCDFDFQGKYGNIGAGFIHVHHLVPLSTIGKEYKVDPKNDLRPVCPNCHEMLHRTRTPMSIDKLRSIIRENSKARIQH